MAFVYVDCPPELKRLLQQLLGDAFMRKHSRFQSFEAFRYSSAVFVNWNRDQMIYDEAVFDNFVKESTVFSSWDEMIRTATDAHFKPTQSRGG